MNDLFDQQIADGLHRSAARAAVPGGSLSDVHRRVRRRRHRHLAAVASPVVLSVAWLGMRSTPDESAGLASGANSPAAPVDPVAASGLPGSRFAFETPNVRMTADSIEVIVGDQVIVPTDVSVHGDPGSAEFTTLELSWVDAASTTQMLHLYFRSDGSSWWASEIRTTDANGEWVYSPQDEPWFTSPLGTAWTGDLDLGNLRITGLTIEAFLPPAVCAAPGDRIAVVSAYPTIEGIAGGGFAGRIDLIDTVTCTAIDPMSYVFTTVVDDPSIAVVASSEPFIASEAAGAAAATDPRAVRFGRFSLELLAPGTTTVRVTVTDAGGAVIGAVTLPVIVRLDTTTPDTTDPTATDQTPTTIQPPPVLDGVVCLDADAQSDGTLPWCSEHLPGARVMTARWTIVISDTPMFVVPADPAHDGEARALSERLGLPLRPDITADIQRFLPAADVNDVRVVVVFGTSDASTCTVPGCGVATTIPGP